jgi:battenin
MNNNEVDDELGQQLNTQQLNRCITAFASGTGCAGIVGYGYKSLLSDFFGWGMSAVVFSVVLFAAAYYSIFNHGLYKEIQHDELNGRVTESSILTDARQNDFDVANENDAVEMVGYSHTATLQAKKSLPTQTPRPELTSRERFRLVLSLWPYTIPLFTVYAAEYMLQVRFDHFYAGCLLANMLLT